MASAFEAKVADVTAACPRYKNPDGSVYRYSYGTAGFRDKAERLPSAMVRVGVLAALESKFFNGKVTGVVITASHNQACDNGAKIMDWRGEMMSHSWEDFAADLANAAEGEAVVKLVKAFAAREKIDLNAPAKVFVGRDTRASSPSLQDCVIKGATAMGASVYNHGEVTTPQLHWIVRAFNAAPATFDPLADGSRAGDLHHYNKNLADALSTLLDKPVQPLTVDCANGIGAVALNNLAPFISKLVPIQFINSATTKGELLNNGVGAEHVQKTRCLPQGVSPSSDKLKRFASIDGDADRVVYFYVDENEKFCLLDGDKIIALVVGYLKRLTKDAGLDLQIGVVQTAYANGAATNYIEKVLGVPVACVPTGVKFLHHKAAEFDIGVYFEANGHGTVLFSDKATQQIEAVAGGNAGTPAAKQAAKRLRALSKLINQAVGDAISDIMLVEVVLANENLTLQKWNAFYADLPSHQAKVRVKDRSVVVTTDAERRVTAPAGLQPAIDAAVSKFKSARAFVRPSGTEDVIRTYAEASTEAEAKQLGELVAKAVAQYAGGV
ncbi:Phosphoacetylglucosamine mutase [Plasmodiophora brassicae]|uniref:Phosphoacetylglucosamine mutase n=1 Tax=Plasmodiophora brassicae TaxID=37360 RepID=A0A0G4INM5_PLABS|nr:hypothetical protein PBRA_005359 [Plasmodiophora brassicae]SPR00711.1 unnamed protein product [Plasmodiophora brassicae]